MVEILAMATIIAPITNGVIQAIKKATKINKEYLPLLAIVVGIGLGALAFFLEADVFMRMWAGGVSGLAAVGLFEFIDKLADEEINPERRY